jgi:3-oxoacyl-[acyl-carrier-protein] synthase II
MGVVSSIGIGRERYWEGLAQGRSGIGPVSLFDTSGYRGRLGAEVRDAPVDEWREALRPHRPTIRFERLSRCDVLGLGAALEALGDAGLDFSSVPPERVAVVMGSGAGGLLSGERFRRSLLEGRRPRPSLLAHFTGAAFTDTVAALVGAKGMRSTISTACSSSATAIGIAGDIIRGGLADVVITGGSESLAETTFSGFNALRSVDPMPCRPFDRDRKGISLGEGAAVFVVEALGERTGTRPYAEIAGYGLTSDAYHVTAPAPDGVCIAHAMSEALRMSGMEPTAIDYVNAHGTGTPANDAAETTAIKAALGSRAREVPVSSTKSMIGHCLGAAGALEAAASMMAVHEGVVPPTVHHVTPDPECDLDYVTDGARRMPVRAVLSNSLAFGGNNTALVLRSPA